MKRQTTKFKINMNKLIEQELKMLSKSKLMKKYAQQTYQQNKKTATKCHYKSISMSTIK